MPETLDRTYFRQAGIRVEPQVYLDSIGYVDLMLNGWRADRRHAGQAFGYRPRWIPRSDGPGPVQATQEFALRDAAGGPSAAQ